MSGRVPGEQGISLQRSVKHINDLVSISVIPCIIAVKQKGLDYVCISRDVCSWLSQLYRAAAGDGRSPAVHMAWCVGGPLRPAGSGRGGPAVPRCRHRSQVGSVAPAAVGPVPSTGLYQPMLVESKACYFFTGITVTNLCFLYRLKENDSYSSQMVA